MRGNLSKTKEYRKALGPIPARAGQPQQPTRPRPALRAYPRACGATVSALTVRFPELGLSPRVRGNPHLDELADEGKGPIPARAGQPPACPAPRTLDRAYPRACGATKVGTPDSLVQWGLSPRVRGNPLAARYDLARLPAYPRACGATLIDMGRSNPERGLSPRVRGNQIYRNCRNRQGGPIPARAGQPGASASPAPAGRAYPRACGATQMLVPPRRAN